MQLELFLAVNLVQVVLVAIRIDEFIKWSWLVRISFILFSFFLKKNCIITYNAFGNTNTTKE